MKPQPRPGPTSSDEPGEPDEIPDTPPTESPPEPIKDQPPDGAPPGPYISKGAKVRRCMGRRAT
jgi:hypothetical protein